MLQPYILFVSVCFIWIKLVWLEFSLFEENCAHTVHVSRFPAKVTAHTHWEMPNVTSPYWTSCSLIDKLSCVLSVWAATRHPAVQQTVPFMWNPSADETLMKNVFPIQKLRASIWLSVEMKKKKIVKTWSDPRSVGVFDLDLFSTFWQTEGHHLDFILCRQLSVYMSVCCLIWNVLCWEEKDTAE